MKSSYIGKKIGQVLYLNRLPGWNSLKKNYGVPENNGAGN